MELLTGDVMVFLNGSVVRATLPMLLTKLEIGLREAEPIVTYLGEF